MKFDEFVNIIKKNSEKGQKTEFFKLNLALDDYRKTKPTDFGLEDAFLIDYDKQDKNYVVYYPEEDSEVTIKKKDIEDEFYNHAWGSYMHK